MASDHPITAAAQTITSELRRWIITQAEAGCRPADIVHAMTASGWQETVALQALQATLREHLAGLNEPDLPEIALPPAIEVPQPVLDAGPVQRLSDGHTVHILSTLRDPRVVVFGGLLSDAECAGMVALATPRLARSETVDNHTGGSEVNAARTSQGMFFERGESTLVATIEQRIAELLRWPLAHGEGMQVLRYAAGAEYRPHYDYFDPAHPGTPHILQRGGQRVATLVMYLNTPEAGGATTFPDVGFEVAPLRGNAVFFSYDRPHPCTSSLHGGAPVTAGEKWVATKWLREGVFT